MKFKPKGKTKLMSVILAAAMLLSAVPSGLILPALASDTPDVSVAVFTDIGYMTPGEQGVGSEDFDAFRRNSDTLYEYMEGILDSALASVKDKALKGELRYLIVNGSLTATGSEKSHLALAAKLKALEDSTDGALQVIAMAGEGDINASSFSFESGVKRARPESLPLALRKYTRIWATTLLTVFMTRLYQRRADLHTQFRWTATFALSWQMFQSTAPTLQAQAQPPLKRAA